MNPRLEQFLSWWNAHTARERLMLGAGAALVALAILYLGLWEPLHKARRNAETHLTETRQLAVRLQTLVADVQRSRGSGSAANRNLSLLAAVDQASKLPELGKQPSRIQPNGDKEVNVWFDDVAFDALLQWMQILQTQYGLSISATEIERSGTGTVSVRLSLVRS